jgi:hypothetical protein
MPNPVDLQQPFDNPRGLTGSETAILMYAREFVRWVNEVHIIGNFVIPEGKTWEGVHVHTLAELPQLEQERWDAAFAWMDPRILQGFKDVGKKVLNQQVNDFNYCQNWESYIDVVTSPADTHRRYLQQHSTFPRDRWLLWPNAVDQQFYWPAEHVRERKLVYASSPSCFPCFVDAFRTSRCLSSIIGNLSTSGTKTPSMKWAVASATAKRCSIV